MLEQKQKKIMSGQDFTNRLAFFVAAIESCAVHLYGPSAEDGRKREDTRKNRSVLLFLPNKPKDSDLRLYNNLVFHRYYREKLAQAQADESQARQARMEITQDIEGLLAELSNAKGALSKAKQSFFQEKHDLGPDALEEHLAPEQAALDGLEGKLAEAREEQLRIQGRLKTAQTRATAARTKIEELDRERAGKKMGAFRELAEGIRAENGLPHPPFEPDDPRFFDDVVGLGLAKAEPDNTFVSRAATDDSNSAILNHFVICNEVVAPAFAAEGIPPCRDSFIRDTDPAFARCIILSARKRVASLIALPELSFGYYPTPQAADKLTQALLGVDASRCTPGEINIVYEIVTSDAFPVMIEEVLKPALTEGLGRFGGHDALDEFARKLSVLSYNEQCAREAYARALAGVGNEGDCYIARLAARSEVLGFLLSASLLGPEGIGAFEVNMDEMQDILTKQPRRPGRTNTTANPRAHAVLIEQIPNQEGGFSLGRSWVLDAQRGAQIGRAPFDASFQHIVVPAERSPFPGLSDFAASVSRAHALIDFDGKDWLVSDAGSSYGTVVLGPAEGRCAGRLLVDDECCPLRSGDVLALAPIENADGSASPDAQFGFSYRFELVG